MGHFWVWLWVTGACLPLIAAPSIKPEEYKQRRAGLRTALGNALIVLFGQSEREGGEIRAGFFQEPNFYYLTGWTQPGAILVMTPQSEMLLLPARDATQERWTGPKAAPGDASLESLTGFTTVLPAESFEQNLPKWASEAKAVYSLGDTDALRRLLPTRDIRSAAPELARRRMKKSPAELAAIQHATDAGVEAHRAAWKRIRPGVFEYQIAASMSNVYFDRGCERHAYAPIVGSGPNATILHYSANRRRADAGELMLMDVGPECSMYATDITRTVPVSGKFTQRQREIYEIVLGAQKAAIAALKPGMLLGGSRQRAGIHKVAAEYIETRGYGKYFIHGVGHHIGLDVHDAFDPGTPLEAGMVVTVEPGIYIPEEGIGVRIEDVVLITEDGARILSEKLPREAADIERAMAGR